MQSVTILYSMVLWSEPLQALHTLQLSIFSLKLTVRVTSIMLLPILHSYVGVSPLFCTNRLQSLSVCSNSSPLLFVSFQHSLWWAFVSAPINTAYRLLLQYSRALIKKSGIAIVVMSRQRLIIAVYFPSSLVRPTTMSLCVNLLISFIARCLLAYRAARGVLALCVGIIMLFAGSRLNLPFQQ